MALGGRPAKALDIALEVIEVLVPNHAEIAGIGRRHGVVRGAVGADAIEHVIGNEAGLAGHQCTVGVAQGIELDSRRTEQAHAENQHRHQHLDQRHPDLPAPARHLHSPFTAIRPFRHSVIVLCCPPST